MVFEGALQKLDQTMTDLTTIHVRTNTGQRRPHRKRSERGRRRLRRAGAKKRFEWAAASLGLLPGPCDDRELFAALFDLDRAVGALASFGETFPAGALDGDAREDAAMLVARLARIELWFHGRTRSRLET